MPKTTDRTATLPELESENDRLKSEMSLRGHKMAYLISRDARDRIKAELRHLNMYDLNGVVLAASDELDRRWTPASERAKEAAND